jgi:hypothetical protein
MRQKFIWTIPLVSHLLWVLVLPVLDWWQDGARAGSFWDIKVQHTSLLNPCVVHLSVTRSCGHILTPWGNPAEQKIDNHKRTFLYHKISLESNLVLLENWEIELLPLQWKKNEIDNHATNHMVESSQHFVYLSGMKREECVAPIPGRPCFTGL